MNYLFNTRYCKLILSLKQSFNDSTNVHVWPKEIKDDVNKHLHKLETQLKHYDTELNNIMNYFQNYSLRLQHFMEISIELHMHFSRMDIEHKIERVYYDCHIQALKLEYNYHHPNEYQVYFYRR